MKKVYIVFFMCFQLAASGQFFEKDSLVSKLNVGIYPNMYYTNTIVEENSDEFVNLFSLQLRPYIAYNVCNNLFLGCSSSYEIFVSDFYEKKSFVELGCFIRYVLPYSINKDLIDRFRLYFELGYYKTNYCMFSETINTFTYKSIEIYENFTLSSKLDQAKIVFPIGFTVAITDRFYIDINWQYSKFINGGVETGFMGGVGYTIGKKKSL